MTYIDPANSAARTPCTLVVIALDYCQNTFGVAPCTATGTPCYNTYPTCKDTANFNRGSRDYEYTSNDAPLPFAGPRPYVAANGVQYLPTEIKDSLSITGRTTIQLLDEPDGDVGLDPYIDQRASVPVVSYWRKVLARNRNYKGRRVSIYEGFIGQSREEFQLRWAGVIDSVTMGTASVKVEVVDLLKALKNYEVPQKWDGKLLVPCDAVGTIIGLDKTAGIADSGYILIDDEIIRYAAIDTTRNQLTGCTRGCFDTVAASHSADAKIQPVAYYAPQNGWDLLQSMLLDSTDPTVADPPGAGLSATDVDSSAFADWREWPGGEVKFSAIVPKPTKLDTLFWEVVDLLGAKCWYSEGQQITVRRDVPNRPGYGGFIDTAIATEGFFALALESGPLLGIESGKYREVTDAENIIDGSTSVDLNDGARLTRSILLWDRSALGDETKLESYNTVDIGEDAEAESANEYGEPTEEKGCCRWLRRGYAREEDLLQFVSGYLARRIWRRRDAPPIIAFGVEIKDSGIRTGEWLNLSTDEVLNTDGSPLASARFQIVRRDTKGDTINLKALSLGTKKIAVIADATAPDYTAATSEEREYGYIAGADGLLPDGSAAYLIF